jgi:hypothetical protein
LTAASQLALQAQARQPYRLVYQVRVAGLEICRELLADTDASAGGRAVGALTTARGGRKTVQVWLEERPLDCGMPALEGESAAGGCSETQALEHKLLAAGLGEHASRAARLMAILYRHESSHSNDAGSFASTTAHAGAPDAAAVAGAAADAAAPSSHDVGKIVAVSPEALLSRKLTRKLSGVLGDVVSVASGCLPEWCRVLPSLCPFLFSFATREQLIKCTAFGVSQTIFWLQEQRVDPLLRRRLREAENAIGQVTEMTGDAAQRAYDRLMHAQEAIERQRIGKLRSDIARVSRDDRILAQADALMQVPHACSSTHVSPVGELE